MRTLIAPLLTLLLSSCASAPKTEKPVSMIRTEEQVPENCPGYIPGNYYSMHNCIERVYLVEEKGPTESPEDNEQEEEAEE